ncbi:biotin-dependent carboxyltransferase (plasmid) [Rhizobium sp. NIBRBAC000502774]|nr:biotin-dependent carboxyltransferase [Rhizobium sp. NIBRBAC000502774]
MIELVDCFTLNSLQDLGRNGHTRLGINRSGVMDSLALRLGNMMVGNDQNTVACEFQMFPVTLRFSGNLRIALTGAVNAQLDGRQLPGYWAFDVHAGQTLVLRYPSDGARTYLVVKGGLDVPEVLGSRSTNLKVGIGGLEGRSLQRGDILSCSAFEIFREQKDFGIVSPRNALYPDANAKQLDIRFIRAGEYDEFTPESRKAFSQQQWAVTPNSNRQGLSLRGEALEREPKEMRSHGIMPGVIQVPPSGQPVIQLSDANCAGGYPKIGCVIDADIWLLGQANAGTTVKFQEVTHTQSIDAATKISAYFHRVELGLSYINSANFQE